VVAYIYKQLSDKGINVQITCSTGIACNVYPNMNACTVHNLLGLEDGRYIADTINDIHFNSPHNSYVMENLSRVQCLKVDACSMLSKKTFETIAVCSRKSGKVQLIFVGDFLQLPPVANLDYDDGGEFCFQSRQFSVF